MINALGGRAVISAVLSGYGAMIADEIPLGIKFGDESLGAFLVSEKTSRKIDNAALVMEIRRLVAHSL